MLYVAVGSKPKSTTRATLESFYTEVSLIFDLQPEEKILSMISTT